ncbi:L-ascorbate metabolism protein UlaG (beta-lactamase superfamily) [Clostridium pascui]|uniref:MBL fold metallo-hydrolase n=1 Tax=Clostridium pascui TaxID=46609 RepID=UPI0019573C45|nr:MBL fold metallo-hydrolase [Clostridium pascui]MBM7870371.1 L-ascorbate metabolism protein UlaG (beta-lactamase superfamily) [Clostridium pascui]
MNKAKIHYLYHDGFAVETQNFFLIFDYYYNCPQNSDLTLKNGIIDMPSLKSKKNIYVFVSHAHHDHFNDMIFSWSAINPNIKYIMSCDVPFRDYQKNYHFIFANKELVFQGIKIKTFDSTDIGVSFFIEVDGLTIFHAGDLNWWHWKHTCIENQETMELSFKKEVWKIAEHKINIAFFPTDPRLEEFFHIGGEYFISRVHPDLFIPMHFWDDYSMPQKFYHKVKSDKTNIAKISKRGEIIEF